MGTFENIEADHIKWREQVHANAKSPFWWRLPRFRCHSQFCSLIQVLYANIIDIVFDNLPANFSVNSAWNVSFTCFSYFVVGCWLS